jgi:hypothetical protein
VGYRGNAGLIFVLALLSALAVAAPAGAATTIGSDLADTDLTPDPSNGAACSPTTATCTFANPTLFGNLHPTTAPSHGVLVRWRVRASNPGSLPIALRVLRKGSGNAYAAVSTSPAATFPSVGMSTQVFPTSQPIRAGELLGLNVGADNGSFVAQTDTLQTTTQLLRWQPQLADGAALDPTFAFGPPAGEITFNADMEADLDCDGLGDETQDGSVGGDCQVTLTQKPKGKVRAKKKRAKVRVAFSAPALASATQCSVNGGPFAACGSPLTLNLKPRRKAHAVSVRALDPDGAPGAAASHSFKVLKKKRKPKR